MIHGIIMAGGSGTRFWPESRRRRPKQLLNLVGAKTMIRATVERILPEIPFERIMVVTSAFQADAVRKQLPEVSPEMVVSEPSARNTAPCIALAAYKLQKLDPDAVMAVLPADHLIGKEEEFLKALLAGADAACQHDCLLTFGVVPNRPETGYGYIKLGPTRLVIGSVAVHSVERFVEKPDPATAEKYVASGRYMWNSGMFIWKVSSIIKAVETYLPALSVTLEEILPALNTPEESRALEDAYRKIEPISVDHGIMEKADNVLCIPVDVNWNDVGSWTSLEDVWTPDEHGNSTSGEVVLLGSSNCIVCSPQKLIALLGVEDLIVVDTPDALMICRKDRAQEVRRLQEALKERGYEHLL